jgi:hypothetical protein
MSEYIHTNGTIKTMSQIKAENSHTSFPAVLTTEILSGLGYTGILNSTPPTPSASTKIIVRDGAEKNSKDQWVEKWKEIDRFSDIKDGKTKAEQDAEYEANLKADQTELIRRTRKPLLEEADWQIHKLEDASGNTTAWKTYRQALRDITKASDIYNITWPTKPS